MNTIPHVFHSAATGSAECKEGCSDLMFCAKMSPWGHSCTCQSGYMMSDDGCKGDIII